MGQCDLLLDLMKFIISTSLGLKIILISKILNSQYSQQLQKLKTSRRQPKNSETLEDSAVSKVTVCKRDYMLNQVISSYLGKKKQEIKITT